MRFQSAPAALEQTRASSKPVKPIRFRNRCQPAEITEFPPDFNNPGSSDPAFDCARCNLLPEKSYRSQHSLQRVRKRSSALARHKTRRKPKRKTVQKLKIAWRLCSTRKPFREPCPRMRTPERGQLEAYTIGCQKPPRGFSGQLRHTVTCPRLDLLYQSERRCARGESKKYRSPSVWILGQWSDGRFVPPRRTRQRLGRAGIPRSSSANSWHSPL